ncbi:MAG: hypothetical protein ACI9HA_000307 [Dinoroseobacter sp.]|jgi:uncharacterized protein (DUF2147 family)
MIMMPGLLMANDRELVVGHWASEGSIFEITLADGTLKGQVRALFNPNYLSEEDADRVGQPRTDDNNPDSELRDRPIIGLAMFSEYQFEDGQWQGKIYDPESGNTYQSRMKITGKGDLEIRGYIGIPMLGRTAKFAPVQRCTAEIQNMILQLEGQFTCP